MNSITSTNAQNVDTDVEIVSDPAGLEDGLEIPESYRCEKRPRKPKYKKKFINYVKFAQVDSVLVDEIPWDVDRDQKYRIECDKEDYIDKAKDGRWFKMHTSSRKGLVGKRKARACQGSLMCKNPNCPKLLSEGIPNTNEFTKDSNVDICKCCGYFVYHAYCGAIKVIEYETQPPPKCHSAVVYAYPVFATTETTFGRGCQNLYPVLNQFLPNMEVFLHSNVVPRVSRHM